MNKADIIRYAKNIPGKKTRRKIVAIYADDFGSIRVKDQEARQRMMLAGMPLDKDRYSRFDTLCSTEDLQRLFEVLCSVKDHNGHHACFTPFANIANPDFEKISESGFTKYYRESFVDTLNRYGQAYDGAFELWQQGLVEDIFHPEYHGTEHINVLRFMQALQSGHASTRLAFNNESVALPPLPGEEDIAQATTVFYIEKAEENEALKHDIKVGMQLFEDLLGYRPKQFTPGAGIYSPALHATLKEEGIEYINVLRYHAYPLGDGQYVKHFLYNGKRNAEGQKYVVRNCVFEPYLDDCSRNANVVGNCLKNIEAAFRMHAPAIISTHRVNFSGGLEQVHRDDSLAQLKVLLDEILRRWPDVEFMNGSQLCNTIF